MALLKQQVISARVTATHHHFAKLNNINKLLRVYSQNVDNLEERAGLTINDCNNIRSSDRIVKLHGEIDNVWCNICHKTFPFSSDVINAFKDGTPPECQYCMEQGEYHDCLRFKLLLLKIFSSKFIYSGEGKNIREKSSKSQKSNASKAKYITVQ